MLSRVGKKQIRSLYCWAIAGGLFSVIAICDGWSSAPQVSANLSSKEIRFATHQTESPTNFSYQENQWYKWNVGVLQKSEKQKGSNQHKNQHEVVLPVLPAGKYCLIFGSVAGAKHCSAIEISQRENGNPTGNWIFSHRKQPDQSVRGKNWQSEQSIIEQVSLTSKQLLKTHFVKRVKRRFSFPGFVKSTYPALPFEAEQLYQGKGFNIWRDTASACDEKLFSHLAVAFDTHLIKWYHEHLTNFMPETVQLVLTSKLDHYAGRASPLKMCVAVPQSHSSDDEPNHSQVIFINENLIEMLPHGFSNDEAVATLLAHELLHLCSLNAISSQYKSFRQPDISEWIFEGWAHAAERACTGSDSNLLTRLDAFAISPRRSALRVKSSASLGRYRDAGIRGATACFFTYLCDTYPEISWKKRLDSGLNLAGIERLYQKTFPTLFREWSCYEAEKRIRGANQLTADWQFVEYQSGDKNRFSLQGSTAQAVLIDLTAEDADAISDKNLVIRSAFQASLQLTILKIQ